MEQALTTPRSKSLRVVRPSTESAHACALKAKNNRGTFPKERQMTLELIEGGVGIPAEPDWKDLLPGRGVTIVADRERAAQYWSTVVAELRAAEKLAVVNGHAIQRLVTTYILYDRAALQVAKNGAIIPAAKTGTPMHSPWWTAMRAADRMASGIEAELTITPRRRASGGKVARPKRKSTAADRFLKTVPTDPEKSK